MPGGPAVARESGGRADRYNVLDVSDGDALIAEAVSAKTAAALAGIPVAWIEDHGELDVSNFSLEGGFQELAVRRTHHDP